MSDPSFPYTHANEKSNESSSSSANTEFKHDHQVLDRTSYLPVYRASHGASAVSLDPPRRASPPKSWSTDTSIQIQRSATVARFDSSPLRLPPTLRGSPIPSHATDNPLLHFGYNANPGAHRLISERHPPAVVMPTGIAQYGGGLIDAPTGRYDPSYEFVHDHYMVESSRIGTQMVPTYLGAGASSGVNPILPSDPTLRWSPGYPIAYPIATYQYGSPPDATLSPGSPGNIDTTSYPSPLSPLSLDNHSFVSPSSETANQNQPQPITTTPIEQLYTLTVPLERIEFPPISGAGEMTFFQCFWENCGIWITSEKEAVKDHLTRAHGVVFSGQTADSACCKWAGCMSSPKKSTLVRHFRSHLGLKWLCSVCKGEYTRTDSVKWHCRKKDQCQSAQVISYPSAAAYGVTGINGNTVTLTKILQP